MAAPKWIRNMLKARGVRFVELHHRDVPTAQEVAHQEHFSGHRVAKVVVVIADGRPVELVLPASRQVNMQLARQVLGASEVRLATELEMERYFQDCEAGAVPPLRHWKGVDVYMDPSLGVEGDILFQEGTHQDAVRINFHDWFKIVQPKVDWFSVEPEPACM